MNPFPINKTIVIMSNGTIHSSQHEMHVDVPNFKNNKNHRIEAASDLTHVWDHEVRLDTYTCHGEKTESSSNKQLGPQIALSWYVYLPLIEVSGSTVLSPDLESDTELRSQGGSKDSRVRPQFSWRPVTQGNGRPYSDATHGIKCPSVGCGPYSKCQAWWCICTRRTEDFRLWSRV